MNHSPWVVYISNGVFLKTTKQFDRVHFNEPFSHLGSYPFSYTIRAFAIFILVLCEKWTQFVNFGKGEGLEALEYALNAIHAGTLEPNPISQNLASPQVQDDSPIPMIKKAKGSRPDTEKKVAAEACKGEEDRIKPSKSLQNKSERTQIMKEARETTLIKTKNATMEAQHGTKRSLAEFLADNDN
jgi:hypothetical protein